jgi:hypothetical protein
MHHATFLQKTSIALLLVAGFFCNATTHAQTPVTLEMGTIMNASGNAVSDGLVVYGAESLKKNITLSDIKGSPYLYNDSCRVSVLYDGNGKILAKLRTRINFYSHELHFLDLNGKEMILPAHVVKRIQYVDPFHESAVLQDYQSDIEWLNDKYSKTIYAQVLNEGPVRLLKYSRKILGTYDSLVGTAKRYMFIKQEDYYLQNKKTVERITKLTKERVLAFTRHETELQAFADQQQLSFKKEGDVITILNQLNEILRKEQ